MKYALFAALLFCLVCLFPYSKYRLSCLYLLVALPATLAFRADSGWLKVWYPWLAGPVVLLRIVAGLEILHRQTEGFARWWQLTGCAFLVGALFAGMGWVESSHPDVLQSFVEFRRLLQIWLAGVFVYVEAFWITQGGGLYRRADHLAALFLVLVFNHGAVSVLSGAYGWDAKTWDAVMPWSWGIDAGVYLLMAIRCRVSPDVRLYPSTW